METNIDGKEEGGFGPEESPSCRSKFFPPLPSSHPSSYTGPYTNSTRTPCVWERPFPNYWKGTQGLMSLSTSYKVLDVQGWTHLSIVVVHDHLTSHLPEDVPLRFPSLPTTRVQG